MQSSRGLHSGEHGSSPPGTEEQVLLERAQRYDPEALGEIYDRYAPKIFSYILYHVGDQGLAEDLTANVFTKMLDAIRSSKGWQFSFSGWLYRIAHNAVIDNYRRSRNLESLPLNERLVSARDDPVSSVERVLAAESVREAMVCLTDEQQMVIELKFFEGLTNLEVARLMGKTEGAIKSLQYRALGALRHQLQDRLGGD
ncbi:MAG: sigma-70 family RNA polymerase sigma factor [Chloroflexi bacterium]|nr:sigma-70 family RNA polymerase sigma factor [Chloroflexota bacterium]